ncbi:MAG TPA: carboxypeptidase regulatory-like domain-containing protein [Bryobacteraceae bacterium]|nr:carboxypeptidase regulatory-like domain-containing protein [Bryobacteraceae bacterium]
MDLSPLELKLCLFVFCATLPLGAQTSPATTPPEEPASITGIVLSDATGQPLRRAQVELRPAEAANGGLVQTTNESGDFAFPKVTPGRYTITVLRDGFVRQTSGRIGAYKMPPMFSVHSGDASRFTFRMTPWAVVSGRVKFDDAEPAVNVAIQLYREYYSRGRHGYALAASTRTDDLGNYRVHGLESGAYYVAALYQAPALPANATEQRRPDSSGNLSPELSYAVTFFPEVQKLADAVAVRLTPGQEVAGIDIFLTLVHTVRIHGRVTSGLGGQVVPEPSITLRWNDPDNTGSVSAPVNIAFDADHNFEIKGVTTGPYVVIATTVEDGKALSSRTPISVADADVANLDIVVGPEQAWKGKVHIEDDDSTPLSGIQVSLEPRRATAPATRATVDESGNFSLPFVPQEIYDLFVANAPEGAYLKSVRVGNFDRLATGLESEPGGDPPAMEVVLSMHGGGVNGRAVTTDPAVVATGATVMLIPDPQIGRVQSYATTYADEFGNFLATGLAPGNYVLLAWLDQPPCEVHNPDDLPACLAHGVRVQVSEGGTESIQVTAN